MFSTLNSQNLLHLGFKHSKFFSTMASVTLSAPKSHNVPNFIGKNYETALNRSIEAALKSLGNPNSTNFSSLIPSFQDLIQSKPDPPLETIWVFTALTFISQKTTKIEPLNRILVVKDLFQLIVSYSASCNPVKSVALVAPVIYNLYKFILEFKKLELGPKVEKKVKSEIESLVDSVVGYINVCCERNFDDSEDLVRPLCDLSSFWVDNKNGECLRLFFPLLSDNCVKRVSVEGCEMVELAGFVIAEAFLLKLCWKVEDGFGEKTRNELKYWIVGSITGFGNSYFYETLASMLLEPVLPIASIMKTEHGEGLRKIIFDALILVEYLFLSPEHLDQLPDKHAKRVNFRRLMVADEAINILREHGETTKAFSYLNAFSVSSLPAQIIKLVTSEIGNEFGASEPNGSSPRAILRWILNIGNKGIKILDDMSDYRAKLMSADLQEEMEQPTNRGGRNPESDLLFCIDKKGQEENENMEVEDESKGMSAAFMAAAHSMESSEVGGRKRKSKKDKKSKKVKFVKYGVLEDSSLPGERSAVSSRNNEDSNSGSEIENPDWSEGNE